MHRQFPQQAALLVPARVFAEPFGKRGKAARAAGEAADANLVFVKKESGQREE